MNRLARACTLLSRRRSGELVKTVGNEKLSKVIEETKWTLVYTCGKENEALGRQRQTFLFAMSCLYKLAPFIIVTRTVLFMGTGYETLLFDVSDGFTAFRISFKFKLVLMELLHIIKGLSET